MGQLERQAQRKRAKNNASTWHITMRADHTSKLTSQTQSDIIVVDNTLIMVILNAQNELEQCDDEEHRRTTGSVDTIGAPTSGGVEIGRRFPDTIGQRGHHRAAWPPSGSVDTIGQRGHHRATWPQSPAAAWTQSPAAAWTPSGLPERPRSPRATEEPRRTTRSHARAAYRGRVLSALVAAA